MGSFTMSNISELLKIKINGQLEALVSSLLRDLRRIFLEIKCHGSGTAFITLCNAKKIKIKKSRK